MRKETQKKGIETIGEKREAKFCLDLWKAFGNRNNLVKKYFVKNYAFLKSPKTLKLILVFAGGEKTTLSVADGEFFLIDEMN
ncbi:MAG: hypothetical protein AAB851_02950 [Patescibacteria group bacterium]